MAAGCKLNQYTSWPHKSRGATWDATLSLLGATTPYCCLGLGFRGPSILQRGLWIWGPLTPGQRGSDVPEAQMARCSTEFLVLSGAPFRCAIGALAEIPKAFD